MLETQDARVTNFATLPDPYVRDPESFWYGLVQPVTKKTVEKTRYFRFLPFFQNAALVLYTLSILWP